MDNLKLIWNQVSCDAKQLEINVDHQKESIFEKLQKEQRLRQKFNPLLVTFIILFTLFFGFIILWGESAISYSKLIGIGFVTLASIVIAIFSQVVKMPLNQFEHDKSSMIFLKMVKDKLNQSRNMLIIGIILQSVFMTLGLYLIIFHNVSDVNPGYLGAFFGFMAGLFGAAIGGSLAFFHTHYKSTYQLIDHFLTE